MRGLRQSIRGLSLLLGEDQGWRVERNVVEEY